MMRVKRVKRVTKLKRGIALDLRPAVAGLPPVPVSAISDGLACGKDVYVVASAPRFNDLTF